MLSRAQLIVVVAAVALLALVGPPALLTPHGAAAGALARTTADDAAGDRVEDPSRAPGQTSEGIAGETAPALSGRALGRTVVSQNRSWRVAPGVWFRTWRQTDRRGPVRAHLVRINLGKPGVRVDYASFGTVPQRGPLTKMLRRDRAVAGVNGGFFDIYDTGAPLGVGQDLDRGLLLHGALGTWDNAFWIGGGGRPGIGRAVLEARIERQPRIEITNVNSPRVKIAGIGIYTPEWGPTSGYRVTDGQTDDVRQVVIQDGLVVSNLPVLTSGDPIGDSVLVGRGPGARALESLPVGSAAPVSWRLAHSPVMAISGESILLQRRGVRVSDNREMHPRTAIGIDRDRNRLLLLVIDGRSRSSRGYTLVELARMMRRLGAEAALNLDGGGSSTMVAENRYDRVKVQNSPSDGRQRSIPDGIGVTYRTPRR